MALYEYTITCAENVNTSICESSQDNIIIKLFKSIQKLISDLIDSFRIMIGKTSSREDLKTSSYGQNKLQDIETNIINSSKSTLDRGLTLIDMIMRNGVVGDETVDKYIEDTHKSINNIRKQVNAKGALTSIFSKKGYNDMNSVLMNTNARIKEDARKLYIKRKNGDTTNRQAQMVLGEIRSFISALFKL